MHLSQLHSLLPELQALLTGARLQGLRQHGPRQFSLELYSGEKHLLWLDLNPTWIVLAAGLVGTGRVLFHV